MKLFNAQTQKATSHVTTQWQALNQHWSIKMANLFVAFFVLASLILLLITWRSLPPRVPLWYSQPWGTDQLAPTVWLFVLPASSILWYGINVLISVYGAMEYRVFAQALSITSAVVSFLAFWTLVHIVIIVI